MFKRGNKGENLVQPAFHFNNSQGNSNSVINQDPAGLKLKWNPYDVYTVENLYNFEC